MPRTVFTLQSAPSHTVKHMDCTGIDETLEFMLLQARLAALQDRAAAQESRLLSNIYPPGKPDQPRPHLSRQGEANQGMMDNRDQTERQSSRYGEQTMEHPWCLEPQDNEATMRDAIRRRESQATMRQNMEMADRKKKIVEQERAREKQIDCSTLTSEKQWWNYGAASEKWIPPEHRVRGRGSKTAYAESIHSGTGDILHWHDDTPRSFSQASITSCNHTAPYATLENAPAPRRTAYRLQAPYHTQPDGAPNPASHSQRPPSDSSHTGSTRPPFSLHDDPAASTVGSARPQRRDSRPHTAVSTTAPFDRDDQPAPPPRRAIFRTGYQKNSRCPFDREDVTIVPRPRERTSTYPYAMSEQQLHGGNQVAQRTHDDGSMSKYGGSAYGAENLGALNNRSPADVHAAGKPSPPKHPKGPLDAGGGRLSPASGKHAHEATTEEAPMAYPFAATAGGTLATPPGRAAPHSPEAPRRMSRGTVESISRRQAMQRSDGVDAALHSYADGAPPVASSSVAGSVADHAERPSGRGDTRLLVEKLVAKHVQGGRVYGSERLHRSHASSNGEDRHGASSMRDGPYGEAGSMRPPYAVLGDRGLRSDAMSRQNVGPRYMTSERSGAGMSQGHRMSQPEWMHIDRPAGKPTGGDVVSAAQLHSARGSSGREPLHTQDQVAKILQHNEASLRTAPGGVMYGMIDQLSRKHGAASLE